jgi:hypothetical protein
MAISVATVMANSDQPSSRQRDFARAARSGVPMV